MKKIVLMAVSLCLSACSNLMNYQIKYEQEGKNCKYSEITGIYQPGVFGNTYKVIGVHEIIYPDMTCKEVAQSDLKNGLNKTISSPMGISRTPVFGYDQTISSKAINVE